jgi:transcriptional regulator with XRE-family HTH domain
MFFEKLKILCDKQGISPTALAAKIDIAGSNVTDWCKGSKPRAATLKAVADYFGVDVSYFTDEANVAFMSNNGEVKYFDLQLSTEQFLILEAVVNSVGNYRVEYEDNSIYCKLTNEQKIINYLEELDLIYRIPGIDAPSNDANYYEATQRGIAKCENWAKFENCANKNVALNSTQVVQGNQNTVTFSNGTTHTRELSEIEAELLQLCEKMTVQQKNELLNFAYSVFANK